MCVLCPCWHTHVTVCLCSRPHLGQQLCDLDRAEDSLHVTPWSHMVKPHSWSLSVGPHVLYALFWACCGTVTLSSPHTPEQIANTHEFTRLVLSPPSP